MGFNDEHLGGVEVEPVCVEWSFFPRGLSETSDGFQQNWDKTSFMAGQPTPMYMTNKALIRGY